MESRNCKRLDRLCNSFNTPAWSLQFQVLFYYHLLLKSTHCTEKSKFLSTLGKSENETSLRWNAQHSSGLPVDIAQSIFIAPDFIAPTTSKIGSLKQFKDGKRDKLWTFLPQQEEERPYAIYKNAFRSLTAENDDALSHRRPQKLQFVLHSFHKLWCILHGADKNKYKTLGIWFFDMRASLCGLHTPHSCCCTCAVNWKFHNQTKIPNIDSCWTRRGHTTTRVLNTIKYTPAWWNDDRTIHILSCQMALFSKSCAQK